MIKDSKIAIVGGTGKFGRHLARELEEKNQVSISGSTVEKARKAAENEKWSYGKSKEIVKDADIVIISVPISKTTQVIHNIGGHVPEDALLCDVTSVKSKPVEAMKQYSNNVLGMHPMYAPSNSIKGQKVVLCPEKGDKWVKMKEFWADKGAEITILEPEEHDKAMSIVQGLMHFSELVIAETINKTGENYSEFSTPVHQLITDLTARMLNQQPELYGSIQRENPRNQEIREKMIDSAEEIDQIIEDQEEFEKKFEELGTNFDLEDAQKRTDKIIEFLSNEVR